MDESAIREIKLAEFGALRDEIGYRSRFQQLLIHLNLLVPATVAAIVQRDPATMDLLLVIPAICAALGLFFADHATAIRLIGEYIKEELSADYSDGRISPWEEWSEARVKALPFYRRYELPLAVVFLFPPLAALVAWTDLANVDPFPLTDHLAWWSGLAATLFMAAVLLTTNLKPWVRRGKVPAERAATSGDYLSPDNGEREDHH